MWAMKNKLFVLFLALFILFGFPTSIQARRGCCSWHGGVDYCDTSAGRYVCNDGTYSPSCGCGDIWTTPVPVVLTTPKPTFAPTPTPTPVPTIQATPTQTPLVQGASTESEVSFLGGLAVVAVFLGGSYLGLKWLARVTAPKEPPIA